MFVILVVDVIAAWFVWAFFGERTNTGLNLLHLPNRWALEGLLISWVIAHNEKLGLSLVKINLELFLHSIELLELWFVFLWFECSPHSILNVKFLPDVLSDQLPEWSGWQLILFCLRWLTRRHILVFPNLSLKVRFERLVHIRFSSRSVLVFFTLIEDFLYACVKLFDEVRRLFGIDNQQVLHCTLPRDLFNRLSVLLDSTFD